MYQWHNGHIRSLCGLHGDNRSNGFQMIYLTFGHTTHIIDIDSQCDMNTMAPPQHAIHTNRVHESKFTFHWIKVQLTSLLVVFFSLYFQLETFHWNSLTNTINKGVCVCSFLLQFFVYSFQESHANFFERDARDHSHAPLKLQLHAPNRYSN